MPHRSVMGPLRVLYISIVIFHVALTKQANSEQDQSQTMPAAIDLLFQNSNSPHKGGTPVTGQSGFRKCPPCPYRKGPKAPVCKATVDLGFVLESSSNIDRVEPGSFRRLIQFVGLIARKFFISEDKARFGVVTYSSRPKLLFGMTGNISTIARGLRNAKVHREPIAKTGIALKFAYRQLLSTSSRFNKVLVVITDGSSSDSVSNIAKAIKGRGIQILSVGVGRYFDIHQLNAMASRPVLYHVFTGQFSKIIHTRNELVKKICLGVGGSYISPSKRPCLCKTG
ncbi:von Willebrand factor A domain-containing protein 2-like [Actinia tenebrosa]|uniref:von Willebrand factor A domain-containing protein 2-like n=1 Tax=Actinia tenebrosa TaxID=6105 RepID=A0A6P8H0K4_ACTTE|nr:von Willebrand factor A domain-containing protein 2-like [Actinia tenebrosa]